jgi:hypothetical protein
MPNFRVTFAFQQYVFGATETYITNNVSDADIGSVIQPLITKRNDMLFNLTNWVGVRVAETTPAGGLRRSRFFPPGDYTITGSGIELSVPARGARTPAAADNRPDQARSCAQLRITYDVNRTAMRYLAFVPDNVIEDEPVSINPNANPDWFSFYLSYRAELVSGRWNIRARVSETGNPKFPILNWVSSPTAPNLLGVKVAKIPGTGVGQNDKVSIKGTRRRGTDRVSYNGIFKVDRVDTTSDSTNNIYYLQTTEAGDPTSLKNMGTMQKVDFIFLPIQKAVLLRGGVHKRGKPLGTPHGRRSRRFPLDP